MVLDIIKNRASIRTYSKQEISDKDINEILEAGRLAPSWVNVQPWHFIAVKNNKMKELLTELANGKKQIQEASCVIVILGDFGAWEENNFKKVVQKREGMTDETIDRLVNSPTLNPSLKDKNILTLRTVEQCTYATAFMLLQAKSMGIDSCIIGAVGNELTNMNPSKLKEVRTLLKIPANMIITGLLTLGYHKEDLLMPKKFRKPFDKVISKEIYGNN